MVRIDTRSSSPKYAQLRDQLVEAITTGGYAPGEKLPPEDVLASQAGVSRNTVRQAITELVQDGLVERRHGSGTFVLKRLKRSGASQHQSRNVGVLVRDISSPTDVYPDIIRGIEDVCLENDYHLVIGNTDNQIDKMSRYINRFISSHVWGAIISPLAGSPPSLQMYQRLAESGVPLVLINRPVPGLDVPAVVSDNVSGGYLAGEHLVKQGHRKIAAVFPPPYSTTKAREEGFRKALQDAGVEIRNDWIQYACTDDPEPEKTMVESLFADSEKPTAIFAFHDELAAAVFHQLAARGLRVPDDVAMVGYNDCLLAMTLPVPLTSVAYPKYEIGSNAARLLLGGARTAADTIVLPPHLVVRASSNNRL